MTRYWCHACRFAFLLDAQRTVFLCSRCGSELIEEIRSEDDPRRFTPVQSLRPMLFAVFASMDAIDLRLQHLLRTLFSASSQPTPANPQQLQRLLTIQWPETRNSDCAICQCEFQEGEEGKRLFCGHVYHSVCVTRWLGMSATCPVCRQGL